MPSSKSSYDPPWSVPCTVVREEQIGILVDMLLTGFDSKYLNTPKAGEGLSEAAIREGYTRFKREKDSIELTSIAARSPASLCGRHLAAHDFWQRSSRRPYGPARAGLEGPRPGCAKVDESTGAAAAKACAGARDLGLECV